MCKTRSKTHYGPYLETVRAIAASPKNSGCCRCVLCDLRDEMFIVGGLAELRTKFVDETCEQAVYDAVDNWKKSAPADSD